MQCNWSSTTSVLQQSCKFFGSLSRPTVPNVSRWSKHKMVFPTSQPETILGRKHLQTLSTPVASMKSGLSEFPAPSVHGLGERHSIDSTASAPMKSAHLSRVAAETVRLAFQEGRSREAFLVVNSLHYSTIIYKNGAPPSPLRQPHAIDFGQAVSPRLAAHCLLHGLIRQGNTDKAGRLARKMMSMGLRVRNKSLEATMHSLCASDVTSLGDRGTKPQMARMKKSLDLQYPNVTGYHPRMVQGRGTRMAIQLLFATKHYQQQRTKRMFQTLIDACLLQGEIIVASFLFAFLVKQWQLRRTPSESNVDEQPMEDLPPPLVRDSRRYRWIDVAHLSPYPDSAFMASIVGTIDMTVFKKPSVAFRPTLEATLQALANFAYLLDHRLLPFSQVSTLIHALYSCPSTPQIEVWIQDKGKRKRVVAREYFLGVLDRLIDNLPTSKPDNTKNFLPPLDRRSYNSLLHYSLRHRFSPALAERVIEHMTSIRDPPLPPNIVTHNILLRSGTLLQRADLSSKTLALLQERGENAGLDAMMKMASPSEKSKAFQEPFELHVTSPTTPTPHVRVPSPTATKNVTELLHKATSETFDFQHVVRLGSESLVKADGYTLTAYIAHLTATGSPEVVAELLFYLIPELHIVDHPAQDIDAVRTRREVQKRGRRACLERAVRYGPHFFTAVMNALRKAGRTGLAERVFTLAKHAEKASKDPAFAPDVRPWCLPVEAYTILMQCYADEGRKGLEIRRTGRNGDRLMKDVPDVIWTPRDKTQVQGWADYVITLKGKRAARVRYGKRYQSARLLGLLLFQSMRKGARHIYMALLEMERAGQYPGLTRELQIPHPDARFYNAALQLFGRQPEMFARRANPRMTNWKRRFHFANQRF
ncbi:hypothetical protein BD410DRAFT_823372, partial [Rickenella mellea]